MYLQLERNLMKAIEIKVLPATDTKPTRLKAWTEAGAIIESRNSSDDVEIDMQAKMLAQRYCDKYQWGVIYGFGTLPSGHWCATLGDK
jgi:hypothetical protein